MLSTCRTLKCSFSGYILIKECFRLKVLCGNLVKNTYNFLREIYKYDLKGMCYYILACHIQSCFHL